MGGNREYWEQFKVWSVQTFGETQSHCPIEDVHTLLKICNPVQVPLYGRKAADTTWLCGMQMHSIHPSHFPRMIEHIWEHCWVTSAPQMNIDTSNKTIGEALVWYGLKNHRKIGKCIPLEMATEILNLVRVRPYFFYTTGSVRPFPYFFQVASMYVRYTDR